MRRENDNRIRAEIPFNGTSADGCDYNTITDNLIGTDGIADLGNGENGISLFNGAVGNSIGPGNVIAYNRARGIGVWGATSSRNAITQNAIYGNTVMGIEIGDGAYALSTPTITVVSDVAVSGIAPVAGAWVELFSDEDGQGRVYEGSTTAGSDGRFTLTKPAGFEGPDLTATARDANGNTSKFSAPMSRLRIPGGDAYEPDGNCEQARRILTDGTPQDHTFHAQGDTDWVRFGVTAGTRYLIEATIPLGSPADVAAELHDQCGNMPLRVQDAAFTPGIALLYTAPASGELYLKLINHLPSIYGSHVTYTLSVRMPEWTPSPGALILVAGRINGVDPLQVNIHHVSNSVYQLFRNQGYPSDRITYLATDLGLTGVTGLATREHLRAAIVEWAPSKVGADRALTVYLVNHGDHDRLYLDKPLGEWVTPEDLNQWLSTLENVRPGVRVNVIVEACHSGSFIDPPAAVSKPGRVVIASTSVGELAWASADGAIFSDFLLEGLGRAQTLFAAFDTARWGAQAAHYSQVAWLDDDGDGVANTTKDGREAARRGFGLPGTLCGGPVCWPPYIIQANTERTSPPGWGVIRAHVLDDKQVRSVRAIVYPPDYRPPDPGQEWGQDLLPTVWLRRQPDGSYADVFTGFTAPGVYRVVVYADDYDNNEARPVTTTMVMGLERRVFLPMLFRSE